LLGALFALAPTRALAGGAFPCSDACSRDPRTGVSCIDQNLGCNASTMICVQCSSDLHCLPGGTCVDRQCVGVVCSYDAGADAGDTGQPDADDGGDAQIMDAEPEDAEPMDALPIDTAFPDARAPTDPLGGPRGTTPAKDPFEEDGCGCSTTSRDGSPSWLLIAPMLLLAQRWRRRGGRGPCGRVVMRYISADVS
jgi:MYXO-CTERM domain-containing protein